MAVTSPSLAPGQAVELARSAPVVPSHALPEGFVRPARTGESRSASVLGVLLLMVADFMVLATMLAAYFALKNGAGSWPPAKVSVGTYIPTVITITAVLSFFSAQWGSFCVRRNDQRNAAVGLGLTVIFGLAIANAEWLSFTRAGFGFNDHAYGTLYYLLIGFHLVHVLAAMAMLVLVGVRALAGHFSADDHEPIRAVTMFWNYTNVVWFAVATALFLLSKHA